MIKAALVLLPLLGLGACASQIGQYGGDLHKANDQLGFAVRQNIAAQTVNPTPPAGPVVANGARTAGAVDAYQKDQVEHPGSATTLSIKGAGGGAGSTGGQ